MGIRDNKRTVHILDRSEALNILGISKEQDDDFQIKYKKGMKPSKLKVNKIKPSGEEIPRFPNVNNDEFEERIKKIEDKVNQIMKFLAI